MSDQADVLRMLVRTRSGALPEAPPARSLLLTSGKGGTGTSNLALNLAIALGEYGQRVLLVDADLGLANLDLLCGLSPLLDLGDVLAEGRPLAEAIVEGPGEIRILAGAHGNRTLAETLEAADAPARLVEELKALEVDNDFLVIDGGSGLTRSVPLLASAADQVIVVTTPEPTSLADAHAALGRLRRLAGKPRLRALVNQARSSIEAAEVLARLAASSREFLGVPIVPLGHVRADPRVPLAVRRRRPFLTEFPRSVAARGVRRLARTLIEERRPHPRHRLGVFAALMTRRGPGRNAP
ncbi:MinD/ParA family protein [soil metagenome]